MTSSLIGSLLDLNQHLATSADYGIA